MGQPEMEPARSSTATSSCSRSRRVPKNGKDVHHAAIAKLARGMIKEHIADLTDLKKALG